AAGAAGKSDAERILAKSIDYARKRQLALLRGRAGRARVAVASRHFPRAALTARCHPPFAVFFQRKRSRCCTSFLSFRLTPVCFFDPFAFLRRHPPCAG